MSKQALDLPAFKLAHPTCCICGVAPTEQRDHIPAKIMFVGKQFPEGFEFPACADCNQGTKDTDQICAFYVRFMDQNDTTYRGAEMRALLSAMGNNYVDLMPKWKLTRAERREALRQMGRAIPRNTELDRLPMVWIPKAFDPLFRAWVGKIVRAIFYHEAGRIMPPDFALFVEWVDYMHPDAGTVAANFRDLLPNETIGSRRNTKLGTQFHYRWDHNQALGIFSTFIHFSESFYAMASATSSTAPGFQQYADALHWRRLD